MNIDFDRVTALIREATELEILPRFKQLKKNEIAEKGPGDIVTDADIEAEKFLRRVLQDHLPGSIALGEESVSNGDLSLDILKSDDPVWIIDPVDGTQNFANGKDTFAVMVSLCRAGEILGAWIHDPLSNQTATAAPGSGAWYAGDRLEAKAPTRLEDMVGPLWPRMIKQLKAQVKEGWGKMPKHVKHYGCVAHEYIDLARGKIHYSLYARLKPWDHAAGILLHREAGGFSALKGKEPYRALEIDGNKLILAPSEQSWETFSELFNGR